MGKAISGIFGGPKPDTSALKRQEELAKQQEDRLAAQEAEQKKREAATMRARGGRAGRESLLSGLETGVQPIDATKRTSLG